MNRITLDDKDYNAPSIWNELSASQLIAWAKICSKTITGTMALRLASIVFYGIKPRKFFKLNAAQQIQLISTLDFLEVNKLTKWVIPKIRYWFKSFYGPANRLGTSTIKEFRSAELYYNTYILTKNPAALDQLIATLYRPYGKNHPDNDYRIPLTDLGVQLRAKYFANLDEGTRSAILFNYIGCRTAIFKKYPTIFQSGDGTESKELPDLEGVIKTVAGGKFGHFNETENTPLYLFFDHMKDEKEAYERSKNP